MSETMSARGTRRDRDDGLEDPPDPLAGIPCPAGDPDRAAAAGNRYAALAAALIERVEALTARLAGRDTPAAVSRARQLAESYREGAATLLAYAADLRQAQDRWRTARALVEGGDTGEGDHSTATGDFARDLAADAVAASRSAAETAACVLGRLLAQWEQASPDPAGWPG
jgi:hypothetical protein